jgi:hypothetical protein
MLVTVVCSPVRGLSLVLENSKASLVLLLIIASALCSHLATYSRIDFQAQKRLIEEKLLEESMDKEISDEEITEKAKQAINLGRIGGYFFYLLGIPLVLFAFSLLLYLLYAPRSRLVGWVPCFKLMMHAAIPLGIREFLSVLIIASYPGIDPGKTHGLFETDLIKAVLPTMTLPVRLDPFDVWAALLVGASGLVLGHRKLRFVGVSLVFWVLFSLVNRML